MVSFQNKESSFPLLFIIIICFYIFNISSTNAIGIDNQNTLPFHFDYIAVSPSIQIPGKPCVFTCIVYPLNEILSVHLVITTPNSDVIEETMQYGIGGKYISRITFQEFGQYTFYINVKTLNLKIIQSSYYILWISSSIHDIDSDGLPNYWEVQYGLNPEDEGDAYVDSDNDGFLNIEEYLIGTNPTNDNLFENIFYQVKEKHMYLGLSLLLSVLLCLFSWFGIRREII